ncbi:TonB-dependent receptor family protein [Tropicimonas sp.]|uniref:TonB-dependent receptor family protein n=1 Tax=Tropicimonas sp. TaxID=2067044 RepID=UPI003A897BF4
MLELEPITVDAGEDGWSLAEDLRQRIAGTPGGASVVGAADIEAMAAPTFADAMAGVPGVVVQEFFGGNDQPRFQIRGSGMQQSPTERGLLILRNGMPVNRADGSYIAGLAAPGMSEAIEIWRGPAANRLGATVLGGAVNFISPTAATAPGTRLSFGGGSFDRWSASGQTTFSGEKVGGLLQFSWDESDGFRDANDASRRAIVSGNIEIEHGEGMATQLFLSYTDLEFEIPGPLTRHALDNDPESNHPGPTVTPGLPPSVSNPGPNVGRDRPRRESTQFLAGARTTIDRGEHLYDLGLSLSRTEDSFRFPISAGERVTDGTDGVLSARYAFRPDTVAGLPLFEATLLYAAGSAERTYYHNVAGKRGPEFGSNDLNAQTLSAYLGANIPLGETLFVSPSLGYTWAKRKNEDTWGDPTRPTVGFSPLNQQMRLPDGTVPATDAGYDRTYEGWTGALAMTWTPHEDHTLWIAASHSFEPPTHDDLIAPVGGTPFSGPGRPNPGMPTSTAAMFTTPDLKAQEADTIELGWRATWRSLGWDLTAYHSRVKNEILSLRDVTGASRASMNADRTLHTGVELGVNGRFSDTFSGRLAWTWQDFRFDDDPVRGNNRLGGSPRNVITAALAWEPLDVLSVLGTVRWVPDETPVDNMNTLWADPYWVADLRARWLVTDRIALVGEVTNLFDETYASSTLVVDAAQPGQAAFIPGEGRAFYIGAEMTF